MNPKRKRNDVLVQQIDGNQVNDVPNDVMKSMDDNPYWGGPVSNQHDLPYLLKQIKSGYFGMKKDHAIRNTNYACVIYEDDDYIGLNKPADLRMDGQYMATVHKLLTYLYPSSSLAEKVTTNNDSDNASGGDVLMQHVLNLHKFNDLKDNQLRPTHQLDYATSGVLLVARSKVAAKMACQAFQMRQTQKQYLALVEGHMLDSSSTSKPQQLPILPKERLSQWEDGTREHSYRKKKENQHKSTFLGYMPDYAIYNKWKAYYNNHHGEQKKKRKSTTKIEDEMYQISKESLSKEESDNLASPTFKWRNVRSNPTWKQVFERMASHYNKSIALSLQKEEGEEETNLHGDKTKEPELPHLFRLEGEDENSFYVHASLAEIKDDFRVQVDPSSLIGHTHEKYYASFSHHPTNEYNTDDSKNQEKVLKKEKNSKSQNDDSSLDYKPSFTRVTILSQGILKSSHNNNDDYGQKEQHKVTKVLLQPRTGRRHQLRLHMVVCGHPILGDVAYQSPMTASHPERMCLHAHQLKIPLLHDQIMTFEAPDPFLDMVQITKRT